MNELLVGVAALVPLAILAWVSWRISTPQDESPLVIAALVGGAVIGPIVALASYGVAAVIAGSLVQGMVEPGQALLEELHVDPVLGDLLRSPWVLVMLVGTVIVAPFTEEAGKALGALFGRPMTRRAALLAGVAAGAGFAVVEDILYGWGASQFGGSWEPILAMRALGAAVHPLATGLVMLGWWEFRSQRDGAALARGYLSGVGVHALWNGAQVAMVVVAASSAVSGSVLVPASLAFTGTLGVIAAGALWRLTDAVAAGRPNTLPSLADPRAMAGWMMLSASMLVPIAFVAIAYPEFLGV